jgi:transcriptional regulator with XRE-family HTH domain
MRENNIHNRIARIRFELNLSKKEFAQNTNVSQATMTRYESGERIPDYCFLETTVKTFNVNPMYLFGISDEIFLPVRRR